jgi:hypothetical protein
MRVAAGRTAVIVAVCAILASCGESQPDLMNVRSNTSGPDEFSILPAKPLEEPGSFNELPTPTPGGTNRTDPTPREDAVTALGGRGDQVTGSRMTAAEQDVVAHAGRYGVSADIRSVLASEDLDWRRDNDGKVLERLLNVNVYYRAYRDMSLDQHKELQRLRRLGIWTPSAPPGT